MKGVSVLPHGPIQSSIALIAEAPDKDEISAGIPMVGYAGKLLNEILSSAGIYRSLYENYVSGKGYDWKVTSSVYVTHLSKSAPWNGDFESTFYENKKARKPNSDLLECTNALATELGANRSNVLVAMGDHVLQALTGKRGITKWRGSILESTLLPGRKVIPVIEPHKILKEYSWKVLATHDFKRIRRQSFFPDIRRPPTEFIIGPTLSQVVETLEEYSHVPKVAFDIETRGNHISCIGFAKSNSQAICIPFTRGRGNYWDSPLEEIAAWRAVAKLLGNPNVKKIGQNLQFDCSYLLWHGLPVRGIWWDTMLAQNILYPELEKSLAVLGSIYTEHPYYKDEGRAALGLKSEKAWSSRQIDEQLWIYNARDCIVTFGVQEGQQMDFDEMRIPEAA